MALRPLCAKFACSWAKEANYANAFNDSNINKAYIPLEPIIPEFALTLIDDSGYIKAFEWPFNANLCIVTAQDVRVPFGFPADLSLLGMMTFFAMGSNYSANGANNQYVHTYKAQNACANDQMPSTEWIIGVLGANETYQLVKGIIVNELTVALESQGQLTARGTAFSDGTMTPKNSFSWPANYATGGIILGKDGDFLSANEGANQASLKTLLRGFEFRINNNLDVADGRSNVVNATPTLTSLRFGNREYELVVRVEGHVGDQFWTDYINGTMKDIEVKAVKDANNSYSVRFKRSRIYNAVPRFDGIRDVLELTYRPFFDSNDGTPVTVTIKNQDAGYGTNAT